jgi:hypothetical protein
MITDIEPATFLVCVKGRAWLHCTAEIMLNDTLAVDMQLSWLSSLRHTTFLCIPDSYSGSSGDYSD